MEFEKADTEFMAINIQCSFVNFYLQTSTINKQYIFIYFTTFIDSFTLRVNIEIGFFFGSNSTNLQITFNIQHEGEFVENLVIIKHNLQSWLIFHLISFHLVFPSFLFWISLLYTKCKSIFFHQYEFEINIKLFMITSHKKQ